MWVSLDKVQVDGLWVHFMCVSLNKQRKQRSRMCQEEEEIKILSRKFVSKWLKWKLGRRPGHRSIWTVFVSWRIRLVSIFPSLVEISRIQTVWVSKITTESWIMRKRWSWTRLRRTRIKGKEEEDPRQSRERLSRWQERLRRGSQGYAPPIGVNCQKSFLSCHQVAIPA